MSDVSPVRFTVLNLIGAVLWAVVIGVLGYLCGHVLELIMGDIKHLEVPILIGITVVGGLLFFVHRRRRGKVAANMNS